MYETICNIAYIVAMSEHELGVAISSWETRESVKKGVEFIGNNDGKSYRMSYMMDGTICYHDRQIESFILADIYRTPTMAELLTTNK